MKGIIAERILPFIHDIPQLDAIYILCSNPSQHQQWTKKWIKIKSTHTDIQSLCGSLQMATKQCDHDSILVSFVTVNQEASSVNLNQLEPSFMYTQMFNEILLDMDHDEKSIKVLTDYCRTFYKENARELNIIEEFERDYRSKSPIWWYTPECFTDQILNRALRALEGDTIVNMGFFHP